ncbi:hypothetical protein CPC08DRAFT_706728 [Agrocybe pediades]|nr:hypothetical protein CPC08DRAFT_706728 [Agrocybe pediades]
MLDAFNFMYNSTSSLDTISNICQNLTIILADGLLMWRCYLVWTASRQVAWIPCIFWLIEAALSITIAAAEIAWLNDLSDSRTQLMNVLTAALFFMSALTSLISTYLIAYRIYVASRLTGASKRRFMDVIDIVVQSSAVYTLSVLAVATYAVIPFQDSDSATIAIDTVVNYLGSIALPLIGIMPTLMVARVAMSSGKDGTTVASGTAGKPSTIHFQSRGADFRQSWASAESDELDFCDERWKKDALDRV